MLNYKKVNVYSKQECKKLVTEKTAVNEKGDDPGSAYEDALCVDHTVKVCKVCTLNFFYLYKNDAEFIHKGDIGGPPLQTGFKGETTVVGIIKTSFRECMAETIGVPLYPDMGEKIGAIATEIKFHLKWVKEAVERLELTC